MAVLSANAVNSFRFDPAVPVIERIYKATGADEYYIGSVTCSVSGKAILTNADAALTLGFCTKRATITAADQPVTVAISGLVWVAAALLVDAALITLAYPLAASDNPADIVVTAATNPSALGLLVHVDSTAVSGWIDLSQRGLIAQA